MSGNTVEVARGIWRWVLSAAELSDDNKAKLDKWIKGEKAPTFNQLEKFSKETRIPLGYFFLKTPPAEECKLLEYRTVDSGAVQTPSRDLFDTVRQMESVQEWMREYLVGIGAEKIHFVGSINPSGTVLAAAEKVRQILKLSRRWCEKSTSADDSFKILRERINSVGVVVMMNGIVGNNTHRQLNVEEFRAFTLIDEYAPLIFINSTDSKYGKIFSILHELIHIGIGTKSLYNARQGDYQIVNPLETFCNAVTAEVLVPKDLFVDKWNSNVDDVNTKIAALSTHFRCSRLVIARRALDLHFIEDEYYAIVSKEAKKGFARKESGGGGDYYKTQATRIDHRFLFALESSVREGRTLYTDAFRLTNTNRGTFENLVKKVQGERT
jgi:Zn-dependent peptidase ImmA (M78 family)